MTIKELHDYFGSYYKAAKAINIRRQSISVWVNCGYIPIKSQYKLEKYTKGALIARLEDGIKTNIKEKL